MSLTGNSNSFSLISTAPCVLLFISWKVKKNWQARRSLYYHVFSWTCTTMAMVSLCGSQNLALHKSLTLMNSWWPKPIGLRGVWGFSKAERPLGDGVFITSTKSRWEPSRLFSFIVIWPEKGQSSMSSSSPGIKCKNNPKCCSPPSLRWKWQRRHAL